MNQVKISEDNSADLLPMRDYLIKISSMSYSELVFEKQKQVGYGALQDSDVIHVITKEIDSRNANINTPEYYDNSKGSLYKVAEERKWNSYLFDVVKRLERGGKKDPIKQEIEKSILVLKLWLKEI